MRFITKAFGSVLATTGVFSISSVALGVMRSAEAFLPYIGFGIILGLFILSVGLCVMSWTDPKVD